MNSVDSLWPYIEHAFKKSQDAGLFRATLACITAMVHKFREQMANRLNFIDKLLSFLQVTYGLNQDSSFDRISKLDIMTCLGDIVLACGRVVIPHLDKMMGVIAIFCEGAIELAKVDFSFSEQIKDCIIDTLFCVFHGLCEEGSECS